MNTRKKGKVAEDLAVEYLLNSGYKILERNYCPSGYCEADIIAMDGSVLVAVEVKAINACWANDFIQNKVNDKKKGKIKKALLAYSSSCDNFEYMRVDVILIANGKLTHYRNVL